MKVDYVNPFLVASLSVLRQVLNVEPERGAVSARPKMFTTQQCNIITGVAGKVEGQVIYGMSMRTADNVASLMIGQPVDDLDQVAASAIAELGNMITGNAMTLLADAGFNADITPPTLVRGSNVRVSTLDVPALVIPLALGEIGTFEVNVSLQERRR